MKKEVIVLVGAGEIGIAIARRIAVGKELVLADLHQESAEQQAVKLRNAGFKVHTIECDVSSREAIEKVVAFSTALGEIKGLIHTAGVSPSQASAQTLFKVDLYGTAVLLEAFRPVIAQGGSAIVIGSQSSHRLPPLTQEQSRALALTPSESLLELDFIKNVTDSLRAYQLSKRGNTLRVQMEAIEWGKRGARVNCISAGIIYTPLANDELNGERKDFYQKMLSELPVGRGGAPDEIANLAELIMSERGAYITGSDFLIDGGATAKYWWQDLENQP
ncbi:SDR family oxidoreductase [Rodentibacter myodis]|uniref:Short-chain dehydrogenase n=1 Tax=Rodentibacter myodis TaxID=1907939 RepID=A0A1V3JFW1_9PAST|nr:SDR family oxidoreductase [Rodentibacter myodis]OOF55616.1 short-chain dehydrogenase [Rodentibacter myodis]